MAVIQELRHLEKLAKEDPTRRFDRLYRLLRQVPFLRYAQECIQGNHGAQTPGVDGRTLSELQIEDLERLSQELTDGSYQPQPVRRVYIPKSNGKLRPLGIPSSRDKIVESGLALILNALYEPVFHDGSHGFRPGRSTITALRQVSTAYRAGATWIIEGDLTDCFGSISHGVLLNCLRKRIRDERLIDLVRKLLKAGVMEAGQYRPSYSGTPQGGVASPVLANVVLHELDDWLVRHYEVNPPPESAQARNARSNPAYMRLHYRINDLRRYLDGKRPLPKGMTVEAARQELREMLRLRAQQPRSLPRRVLYYTRYADDFLIVLCNTSKAEAEQIKATLAVWLKDQLALTLNQDKTLITHWHERLRFLGYELEGRRNPNGTGWLHLNVPKAAVREVVAKIRRATRYPQAPEYDVFCNVNAVARGWTNYYRYAHDNYVVASKLALVVFWQTAHYLATKHKCSIAKIVRRQYARDPATGCKALFTYQPGQAGTAETRCFLWHKVLPRLPLGAPSAYQVQDRPSYVDQRWAKGRSHHQRLETWAAAEGRCQQCGREGGRLVVHHPNRLSKAKRVKKGYSHVAQSGLAQQTKLLCQACHMAAHREG